MGVAVFPAAASGPTLAEIETAVSTYSKGPLDVDWTNIGYITADGLVTATFTGLSGYKYLKVVSRGLQLSIAAAIQLRFNSDSSNNYYWSGVTYSSNGYPRGERSKRDAASYVYFGTSNSTAGNHDMQLQILNNNSSTHKFFNVSGSWFEVTNGATDLNGIYMSTSAISSLSISVTSGNFQNPSPWGFYMYGGN